MADDDRATTLWAASLYGANTKTGRVDISDVDADGKVLWQKQLSIDEARDFALNLIGAAEAAETDELLVAWLTQEVKVPLDKAAQLLIHFRTLRDARKP